MADSQQEQIQNQNDEEVKQKPVGDAQNANDTNTNEANETNNNDASQQPVAATAEAAAASSGETGQPVATSAGQEPHVAATAAAEEQKQEAPPGETTAGQTQPSSTAVDGQQEAPDGKQEAAGPSQEPVVAANAADNYQTNRPNNRDEEVRQSNASNKSAQQKSQGEASPQPKTPTTPSLKKGLEKERSKLQTEMGQIPEAVEPEETARDHTAEKQKPSTSQGAERDKSVNISMAPAPIGVDGENAADLKYQTSPKAEFQNAVGAVAGSLNAPQIEIDRESLEFDYSNVTAISINRELYLRLVKTAVISIETDNTTQEQVEDSKETLWPLSQKQSGQYLNGTIFGRYLIFLKKHMKHTWNQIWSIKVAVIKELQQGIEESIIKQNWQILASELDKISINIQDDSLEAIYRGDQKPIDMMFNRIERYSKMITDAQFLKYEAVREEDKYNDGMDDTTVYNAAITDENLSEMISLRQQQTFRSNISKPSLLSKMITRGETKIGSKFILPPGINLPPQKSETMKANNLRVRGQKSDDIMDQSVNSKEGGVTDLKVAAEDFGSSEVSIKNGELTAKSPKPVTETLGTDIDVTASNDQKQMENILIQVHKEPSPITQTREPKKVKDGVDILALSADKDVSSCDSSLELILVTLSKSFLMSPKQAAALLTNNNQYLIIACVKGVKGGKFEPLLAWYDLLISNSETLAELLQLEMEQLPASAKQTFVKVMAAVGCGFFSSNIELVQMTLAFFTELFQQFQSGKSMQALEQATKWFLSDAPPQTPVNPDETTAASLLAEDSNKQQSWQNQQELINAGGLKLSVYALRKHQEVTRQTMVLYNVFFQSEEQAFMIYATEIQASTKTILEYMELVGEFLPIMSEMWPETAINSGLVDYWLDLCSREAENDFKVQNREKVLAISLLAEIWLLFTDYVDDKDEVTNTLIFVFKRTVSERTKSIRLLSIAYLFKILEKLIEMKKKAALTLYRTLIFSLVESPSDPTIRELYFTNFTDLFRANPKMPSEWLTEPLLKQIQAQLNITFTFKIFDFTFLAALIEHPKFNDEHATLLFSLFAQVSQDDTSYATAAHQIMLITLQRIMGDQQSDARSSNKTTLLQEKAQEHVRYLFDLLLDLEPITRAAALTLMKRQQRQNALKFRQGAAAGRTSQASIGLVTPGSSSTGKPPLKARDLLGSKSVNQNSLASLSTGPAAIGGATSSTTKPNSQKDILRRHKKSLIITFLLKVQDLGLPQLNNNFLRELTFEKTREFKGVYGYFNKGHIELLKAYGDPETLIADCQLDPQLLEQQQLEQSLVVQDNNYGNNSMIPTRKTSVRASPYTRTTHKAQHARGNGAGGAGTPSRNTSQRGSDARLGSQDSKDQIVAVFEDDAENTQQLVPYTEQSSQANTRARSIGSRARALQEIEKIKKQKQEREQRKIDEEQKLRVASAKRKKRLKIEIEKRKHALGIADKTQYKYASMRDKDIDDQNSKPQQRSKQVMYIKLDEEEDRDKDTVIEYMRKFQKLWRNIFAKYANTGHKANALQKPTFDSKSQSLTYAEIMKLLKDHGMYPQHISKEELSQMIRMINTKNEAAKSADIQSLTYQGYQSFIIQLAVHCFSRPPHNLSSAPMVKSIETLVATFEEATRNRNLSTLLYEDPDAVVALTQKDKDLIRSLNQTVKEQPDYPMPEGFLKVKERVPVYDYTVPKATVPFIGESNAICVEVVDELINKLFDFHVLEPQVTMQEQFRVKPSMQRSLQKDSKPGERSNRAEALSIIRRAEEKQRGSIDGIRASRGTNRSKLPKIGHQAVKAGKIGLNDLPPVYKQLVNKQPADKRPIYEQVSVILENMIRKTCGEKELRPQMIKIDSSAAGSENGPSSEVPRDTASDSDSKRNSIANRVQADDLDDLEGGIRYNDAKKLRDRQNALERKQKEKKRQERQKKLKEDLAKLKEERKAKEEEDKVHREEEAKKKKEQEKKQEERRKKLREEQKNEALNKQNEEEKYDAEAAAAQAEQDRQKELKKQKEKREFFRKQQEKLNNQFKNMSDQRKADSEQQKQKVLKEKQQKQQLKNRIDQQNKLGQGHRERQLALDVANFIQKPEVSQLFTDHEKSLLKYFKYYCRQNKVELGHDLQFRLEHLDYNSFNKLGLQSKIIPVLISSEQLKSTFRNTVKQAQLINNADLAGVQNSQDNIQQSQRANSSLDTVNNASGSSSQHIDYESFKKALVRIAILGQELLGGQSEEQRQRKAQLDEKRRQAELRKKELMKHRQEQRARLENETLTEMRQEFAQKQRQIQNVTSRSPAKNLAKVQSEPALNEGAEQAAQVTINEEDFQRWLKQQDAIGNGLGQRVTEKMNKASIGKPGAKPSAGQAAASNGADAETPTKAALNVEGTSSNSPLIAAGADDATSGPAAGQVEDGSIGAPLLRAKQSQARSQPDGGAAGIDAAGTELDISFISADTIKALFDFMHVEAGDEGERNIDQVLAAQSSLEGRGRPSNPAAARRGLSKEPQIAATSNNAPATTAVSAPVQDEQPAQ